MLNRQGQGTGGRCCRRGRPAVGRASTAIRDPTAKAPTAAARPSPHRQELPQIIHATEMPHATRLQHILTIRTIRTTVLAPAVSAFPPPTRGKRTPFVRLHALGGKQACSVILILQKALVPGFLQAGTFFLRCYGKLVDFLSLVATLLRRVGRGKVCPALPAPFFFGPPGGPRPAGGRPKCGSAAVRQYGSRSGRKAQQAETAEVIDMASCRCMSTGAAARSPPRRDIARPR